MTELRVVRLTLENASAKPWNISLEPYGDYCEVPPNITVRAAWELEPSGDLELEITIDDEALTIGNGTNFSELKPSRELPGGELWR